MENTINEKKKMSKKKKVLLIVGLVIFVILASYLTIYLLPRTKNFYKDNNMMKEQNAKTPLLIAHGGGNREFPDNTLEAFYNAYSVDKDMMCETDVSITKDGVVILSHDVTLDRKTNVTGKISDWNYTDLISQKVDFSYTNPVKDSDDEPKLNGERVKYSTDEGKKVTPKDVSYPQGISPTTLNRDENVFLATTLEDLLINFPNNRINIEIKQDGELGVKCFTEVKRLLNEYNAFDRCVLASFFDDVYDEFEKYKQENKDFKFSPSTGPVTRFYILQLLGLDYLFQDKIAVFQIPMEEKGIKLATSQIVNVAHRHNIAVHYWTINDEEDMKTLIDLNVDGIMTDFPHRLQNVYNQYGK